ncbi:MAG: S-adenosyl-l-methionine hydroxide adenosyltransferase family protein [Chloroflexota bacterium]
MTRPIFLLTDFGTSDTFVGIMKAVILGITPDAPLVDLTHEIPPQNINAGAFALLTAAPYLPADAVVLAVVDPGVGSARRPIAVQIGGRTFVGPDNGLLSWPVEALRPRSHTAVVLDRPEFWLPNISASFHGRDIFGPVAAHLASGVTLTDVGSPVDAIQTLPFPTPVSQRDVDGSAASVQGEVVHVDRFGNLVSNLSAADLPERPVVSVAGHTIDGLSPFFQMALGQARNSERLIGLIGSAGLLEIAVPNGSAASALGCGVGTVVTVTRGPAAALTIQRTPAD